MQMVFSETLKRARHCKLFFWCPQLKTNAISAEQKNVHAKNKKEIMYYKCVINA